MPVPHVWHKRPTLSLEITKTCECWQVTSVCHMINNISCNLQCNIIVRHVAEQITCVTLPLPPPLPPPCDLKCNKELKEMLWKRSISCNLRDEISPPSDFIYGIAQDGIVGVIIFMVWFEGDFHVGLTMFLLYMTNAVFSSEASWGKGE